MVKLAQQPQLIEMDALELIDGEVRRVAREGRSRRQPAEHQQGAGRQAILSAAAVRRGLSVLPRRPLRQRRAATTGHLRGLPRRGEEAHAPGQRRNGVELFGFGMRGGKGGYDNWGPIVLSQSELTPGGMTTPKAIAANNWYVDLFRKEKSRRLRRPTTASTRSSAPSSRDARR